MYEARAKRSRQRLEKSVTLKTLRNVDGGTVTTEGHPHLRLWSSARHAGQQNEQGNGDCGKDSDLAGPVSTRFRSELGLVDSLRREGCLEDALAFCHSCWYCFSSVFGVSSKLVFVQGSMLLSDSRNVRG